MNSGSKRLRSEDMPEGRQATVRQQHRCDLCETQYSQHNALLRHLRTRAHRRRAGELLQVEAYVCSWQQCRRGFDRLDHLKRHEEEAHQGKKRKRAHLPAARNPPRDHPEPSAVPVSQDNGDIEGTHDVATILTVHRGDLDQRDQHNELATSSPPSLGSTISDAQWYEVAELFATMPLVDLNDILLDPVKGPYDYATSSVLGATNSDRGEQIVAIMGSPHAEEAMSRLAPFARQVRSDPMMKRVLTFVFNNTFTHKQRLKAGANRRSKAAQLSEKCPLCSRQLAPDTSRRIKHIRVHFEDLTGEFFCERCGARFHQAEDLLRHVRTLNDKAVLSCAHMAEPVAAELATDAYIKEMRIESVERLLFWQNRQHQSLLAYIETISKRLWLEAEFDAISVFDMEDVPVSWWSITGARDTTTVTWSDFKSHQGDQSFVDIHEQLPLPYDHYSIDWICASCGFSCSSEGELVLHVNGRYNENRSLLIGRARIRIVPDSTIRLPRLDMEQYRKWWEAFCAENYVQCSCEWPSSRFETLEVFEEHETELSQCTLCWLWAHKACVAGGEYTCADCRRFLPRRVRAVRKFKRWSNTCKALYEASIIRLRPKASSIETNSRLRCYGRSIWTNACRQSD